ncbi:MAG: ATP-binding domain-containing protein [Candidatus Gastranaerophilales bacterium]|nr:ATP-binding domain-containing protein [Candidatus Gastranaerophilales bacterium]
MLNYDGLYGINNINNFLQGNNENSPVRWGVQTYKINDPIIFNESERFSSVLYNNLKGKIVNIELLEDRIQFDIEIDKVINEFDLWGQNQLELINSEERKNSVVRFSVFKHKTTDEDDDTSFEHVVPFQVAYAVSIHKAQGLEYKSVKIVITNEVDEMITHNIFYTAITRAKENLKIYWSPETEKKVLENLKIKNSHKDISLLKTKFPELNNK